MTDSIDLARTRGAAEQAWVEYRNGVLKQGFTTRRQLRKREFIAGFIAGAKEEARP